jgi:hypothetical protein
VAEFGVHMTCTIRYHRPGKLEDAGLLIIANESEFMTYKARLEASGYVVIERPVAPPFAILAARTP